MALIGFVATLALCLVLVSNLCTSHAAFIQDTENYSQDIPAPDVDLASPGVWQSNKVARIRRALLATSDGDKSLVDYTSEEEDGNDDYSYSSDGTDDDADNMSDYDSPGGQGPPSPPSVTQSMPGKHKSPSQSSLNDNIAGDRTLMCPHSKKEHYPDGAECHTSCYALWQVGGEAASMSPVVIEQGCANKICNDDQCQVWDPSLTNNTHHLKPSDNSNTHIFYCCCNDHRCQTSLRIPATALNQSVSGVGGANKASSGPDMPNSPPVAAPSNPATPQPTTAIKQGNTKTVQDQEEGHSMDRNVRDQYDAISSSSVGQRPTCVYYDTNPEDSHPSLRFPLSSSDSIKRYRPFSNGGSDAGEVSKRYHPQSHDRPVAGVATTTECNKTLSCYTLWNTDPSGMKVVILKQGCWRHSDSEDCLKERCETSEPPRQNNTHFCCCQGHLCNAKFQSFYDPLNHPHHHQTFATGRPVTTASALGPLHARDTLRENAVTMTLALLLSVSLVTVLVYLVYRLCLTRKGQGSSSQPSSSSGFPSSSDAADREPGYRHLDLDQLKMLDLLVRGRYSEVRYGLLEETDVAVKIYQQHHRQYYLNEKSAFSLPFVEHENVVKFFGATEWPVDDEHSEEGETDLESGCRSSLLPGHCIIVTELAKHGSLTSYLKHNTLDWYTLCNMLLGACRGLVHLHTDISRAGMWKPAIVHRDVNTRNILVTSDLRCVVADLGFAVGVMGSKIIRNGVVEVAEQASLADVGTLRYMAPEVLDGAVNLRDCEASLKSIDIYALGLVIWEVASRCVDLYQGAPVPEYQLPYQAEGGTHPLFEEMQVMVVKHKTRPRFPDVWKDSHPAVRSLKETIEDCWDPDAEARLTALCVQERLDDISSLWLNGTKGPRRDLIISTHLNSEPWSNMSRSHGNTPRIINSNGVSVLPEFVDGYNERQRGDVGYDIGSSGGGSVEEASEEDEAQTVTLPLISSEANSGRNSIDWRQEQSLSESTMDTLLPTTPLSKSGSNPNLEGYSNAGDGQHCGHHHNHQPTGSGVKSSNVILAQNHAVITRPSQGRNPTVARNTHKCSDEELAILGNQLVGHNLEIDATNPNCVIGGRPLSKCSVLDVGVGGPVLDVGVGGPALIRDEDPNVDSNNEELTSLVENDTLNDYHTRQQRQHHQQTARNTCIPYVQNQVFAPHNTSSSLPNKNISSLGTRLPKLANVQSGESDHEVEGQGQTGEAQKKTKPSKSLKGMLEKMLLPKELGYKLAQAVSVGGDAKKKKSSSGRADTAKKEKFHIGDISLNPSQFVNAGLETSPQSEPGDTGVNSLTSATSVFVPVVPPGEQTALIRLSTTNSLDPNLAESAHLPSPSLFVNQESFEPGASNRDVNTTSDLEMEPCGLELRNLSLHSVAYKKCNNNNCSNYNKNNINDYNSYKTLDGEVVTVAAPNIFPYQLQLHKNVNSTANSGQLQYSPTLEHSDLHSSHVQLSAPSVRKPSSNPLPDYHYKVDKNRADLLPDTEKAPSALNINPDSSSVMDGDALPNVNRIELQMCESGLSNGLCDRLSKRGTTCLDPESCFLKEKSPRLNVSDLRLKESQCTVEKRQPISRPRSSKQNRSACLMSNSWHEATLRQNHHLSSQTRPKSLSLKGHGYHTNTPNNHPKDTSKTEKGGVAKLKVSPIDSESKSFPFKSVDAQPASQLPSKDEVFLSNVKQVNNVNSSEKDINKCADNQNRCSKTLAPSLSNNCVPTSDEGKHITGTHKRSPSENFWECSGKLATEVEPDDAYLKAAKLCNTAAKRDGFVPSSLSLGDMESECRLASQRYGKINYF